MNAKKLSIIVLAIALALSLLTTDASAAITETDVGGFLFAWEGSNFNLSTNAHQGYAIDVRKGAPGQNFDILAPKDGVVLYANDEALDTWSGDCSSLDAATNYLVLGFGPKRLDDTYSFYNMYYHIAHDSITVSVGQRVQLGQKLAVAGTTGHSTGIHLHMVGTDQPVSESTSDVYACDGTTLLASSREWVYVSSSNSEPIGFEENYNMWPLLNGGIGNLPTSKNYEGIQQTLCLPDVPYVSTAILYEHVDYGGKCKVIGETQGTTDLGNLDVSSIYVNYPSCVVNISDQLVPPHFPYTSLIRSNPDLRNYDGQNWNDRIDWVQVDCPGPGYFVSSLSLGGGFGPPPLPSWLLELDFSEITPLEINIHTKVDAVAGVYDAHRVLVDGNVIFESSAGEQYHAWNTYGLNSGPHDITIEYRRLSDNGNWANALRYEIQYYLDEDSSPPNTVANLTGTQGNNGWYVSAIGVTLTATDNAGVAHTYYQIDGGSVNEGTSFTLTNDAIYNVCYWSEDVNGNIESAKCSEVKIDTTPPVTDGSATAPRDINGLFRDNVAIAITPTDNLSGVDFVECSWDNEQTWANLDPWSFDINGSGVYQFFCRSQDIAGNLGEALDSGPIIINMYAVFNGSQTNGFLMQSSNGTVISGEVYSEGPVLLDSNGGTYTGIEGTLDVVNGNLEVYDNVNTHVTSVNLSSSGQVVSSGNVSTTIGSPTYTASHVGSISYPFDYYWERCTSVYPEGLTLNSVSQEMSGVVCVNGLLDVNTVNVTGDLTFVVNGDIDFGPTCGWFYTNDPDNGMLMFATNNIRLGGNCYDTLGLVYAINGTVSVQSTDTDFRGSIVANHVEFLNATGVTLSYNASFEAGTFDLPVSNVSFADPTGEGNPPPPVPTQTPIPTATPASTATPSPTNTPTPTSTPTNQPGGGPTGFYFALTSSKVLGGVYFDDEDVGFYNSVTGSYSMIFNDSQMDNWLGFAGIAKLSDTEFLLSTRTDEDLPGMTTEAEPEDIVKCNTQTYQCEMYFDGSDVGLNDDVNGIALMPDGSILMVLEYGFSVGGVSGNDYDVVKFVPTSLGSNTSGTFSMYFDGSDVGVNRTVSGIWYDSLDADLCMSFTSPFSAPSGVYVQDEDVICFNGTNYGPSTSGTWASSLKLDFSALGNTYELQAIDFTN